MTCFCPLLDKLGFDSIATTRQSDPAQKDGQEGGGVIAEEERPLQAKGRATAGGLDDDLVFRSAREEQEAVFERLPLPAWVFNYIGHFAGVSRHGLVKNIASIYFHYD